MRRPRSIAGALAIFAALASCKKSQDQDSDSGATPPPEVVPDVPPRVPAMKAPELGAQAGYLDGGLVYASMRIDRVQAFAQKLPLPPDVAGELAEAGAFFGLDFRVDDVRARFGIARDAIVSMTIARPLAADAEAVRAELVRGGPFLDALAAPQGNTPTPPPEVELGYHEEPPLAVPPAEVIAEPPPVAPEIGIIGGVVEPTPPLPPTPPPPSLEAIAQAEKFLRKASTLGIHSRIHIPADNPAMFTAEARRIAAHDDRWNEVCRAIPGEAVCMGDTDMVFILREGKSALDIDIVWFATPADRNAPGRIVAAREAVLASTIERPHLSSLRGDAAMWIDSAAIEQLATVDALGQAVRSVEWTPAADRRSTIDRRLERVTAVHDLLSSPMLYRGVALEVVTEGSRVQARLRWEVERERADQAEALLAGPEPYAEVPTIDALCTGAVACARTRGLPPPSKWRDELATGVWAAPQRELQEKIDVGREWAALVLFAGAWPNFVGAVTRWPAEEIGRGPEAAIANNVFESVGKLEGFGGSLRSLAATHEMGTMVADYAGYARMKKSEVDLVRSLLAFGELQPTDTAITGVPATAQMVRLPTGSMPASLMLFADPDRTATVTGAAEYGWAAIVDGPDRFGWLLGLPRDRAAGPSAYFEVPDLWLLLGAEPRMASELGFARTWLAARHLRVSMDIVDGAPHVLASSDSASVAASEGKAK